MKKIKILSRNERECTNQDDSKTIVLTLEYKLWEYIWKVHIKDYDNKYERKILKQVKKAIRQQYISLTTQDDGKE